MFTMLGVSGMSQSWAKFKTRSLSVLMGLMRLGTTGLQSIVSVIIPETALLSLMYSSCLKTQIGVIFLESAPILTQTEQE